MKELEMLAEELKNYFALKESALRENPNFNSHTEGFLLNQQRAIESFENALRFADTDPFLKKDIIAGFKKNADNVKAEIDKITC